jgi:Tfp pilus assembly protein PilV
MLVVTMVISTVVAMVLVVVAVVALPKMSRSIRFTVSCRGICSSRIAECIW